MYSTVYFVHRRCTLVSREICDCDVIHVDVVKRVRDQMDDSHMDLVGLFKVFGDGTRLRILKALSHEEMCVGDLAVLLGMTKSAVSHQLRTLRESGLVVFRRSGQIIYYSIAGEKYTDVMNNISNYITLVGE